MVGLLHTNIVGVTLDDGRRRVHYGGALLKPRHDLRNHSPDGFNWGYGGSGPAQLALAILAAVLGDDAAAQALYQDYKWEVVAKITSPDWSLSSADVFDWMNSHPDRAKWLNRN